MTCLGLLMGTTQLLRTIGLTAPSPRLPPPPPPARARFEKSPWRSQCPGTRGTRAWSRNIHPWGSGGWRTNRWRSARRLSTANKRRLRNGGRRWVFHLRFLFEFFLFCPPQIIQERAKSARSSSARMKSLPAVKGQYQVKREEKIFRKYKAQLLFF